MADPDYTLDGRNITVAQMGAQTYATTTAQPAFTTSTGPIVAARTDGGVLPAVQAAKEGAAADHFEGTGVSHIAVAQDLGVVTKTKEQHEAEKDLPDVPQKPQDMDTGGLIKQHNTAEHDAMDADTYNTWSHPSNVPKEVGKLWHQCIHGLLRYYFPSCIGCSTYVSYTVKGLDNEELWKLVRRFDKQMYHVKATKDGVMRGQYPELEMDLVNASDEEFSPDRLRSNLERLYVTFVSCGGCYFHVSPLMPCVATVFVLGYWLSCHHQAYGSATCMDRIQ